MTSLQPWQVRWADLDPIHGAEQAGRRPVVLVGSARQLAMHQGRLLTVLPLTRTRREGWTQHVPVRDPDGGTGYVMTDQIRTLAQRRFLNGWTGWTLASEEANAIRAMLRLLLDFG